MRLYFEGPTGKRLAIDTAKERYCSNFEKGSGELPDGHRYIWIESETDIAIIQSELKFCGWSYDDSWIDRAESLQTDPFIRDRRRPGSCLVDELPSF